jgi:outer membrane receptor protein involved in Fe transport
MKFSIFVIVFLIFLLKGYSQVNGKVSGIILEKNSNSPVEFAYATLVRTADSVMVQNTTTDADGNFEFINVTKGNYMICFSFIGFPKTKSQSFEINADQRNIKLGNLFFVDSAIELNEVKVVGQKSTFVNSIDRKIYRVGEDIISNAGSVSDVLQNIPTVQVDVDGSISLRESSNVTILINGKPSGMMSNNPGAFLQQMPANTVEKIEIITNPSAKYKPDGTAGILNIVLKKNKSPGINGNVTANIGNDKRYNGGVILNYNQGRFNLFGNYSYRQDDYKRLSDSYTQKLQNGVEISNVVNTYNDHSRPVSNSLGLGVDYEINKNNNFGIATNYSHISRCRDEYSAFKKDSLGILLEDFNRNRHPPKLENNLDLDAFVHHKFKKEGHELNLNYSNSFYTESTDNYFTNIYRVPEVKFNLDNVFYRHYTQYSQLLAEYTNPFSKTSKLEAGYEFDYKKNEMKIYRDTIPTNQNEPAYTDYSRTTHFLYNEYTHALYVTYRCEFRNFGLLAGLRGETTYTMANLISENSVIRNHYTRLYPSLHTCYKISENHELQLNYSRRIRRPEDEQLNPYPQYLDLWNIPLGNPYLEPEDIHSTEFGFKYKKESVTFLSTLYYRYTQNSFTTITEAHGDTLFSTLYNLSKNQATGLELMFSTGIGKFANINLSSNTFYNVIDASALGYSKNKSIVSLTAKASLNMNLSKNTVWQISSNYTGERLTPQGKLLPSFVLNTGLRQKLFNKKCAIILTVSDVFNSLSSNLIIDTPDLQRREYRKRSARVIYLGFMYSFGSNGKKEKESSLQFDNKM